MSKKDWKKFKKVTVCWLCKTEFEKEGEKMKVRDHCHYTGKFRGAAHLDCNRKFKKPEFTPIFFHNLLNFDSHLFVRNLGLEDGVLDIKCIPSNGEKYISFSIIVELERIQLQNEFGETVEKVVKHEIRFVDSFKFMASSLEKLVGNLPKEEFHQTSRFFDVDLLSRKGFNPYEFMDSFEKFEEILPGKDSFFSKLNGEGIAHEDYEHACQVWKEFGMKNMGEYHDLYLKTDVLLLADVFKGFRKLCECHYELDPAHYYTTPGLAWDAMLKITGVKLELLTDVEMLMMIERGMRGGNSNAFCRFSRANNKFRKEFDESQPSKLIVFLDANNLYVKTTPC